MRLFVLLLGLAPSIAAATPIQLQHQARVVDAEGAPINAAVTLVVGIYVNGATPTALWSESFTTTPENGFVSLTLGGDTVGNPLQDGLFDGSPRYVGVSVAGVGLGARQLIATVPAAVHATNLSGGTVAATSASVAGTLRLGADARACADSSAAGTMRWSAAERTVEVCDGVAWRAMMLRRPGSCRAIKAETPSATSGLYAINPGGGAELQVWCDMDTGVGRTLLMHFPGTSNIHVATNLQVGDYPCTPTSTACRLSTSDISRIIGEPGTQVFEVDPDPPQFISWFQRAAVDDQVWPTNLECNNRGNLAGSTTAWILTSYQSYADAFNDVSPDVGDYTGANHFYPTPYANVQLFFNTSGAGVRANPTWGTGGYVESQAASLWVY